MPRLVQWFFPGMIWAFPDKADTLFLTFDDGPIPEMTPWVLDELKKHRAKATFFCIGENVRKNPGTFHRILSEGHSVGNHTFNHLNGWNTKTSVYIENIEKATKEILNAKKQKEPSELSSQISKLFRPPYGKIKSNQARILREKGYKIIMWSIISFDYDATLSREKCLQNVLKNIEPGSIIVFHDSLKAEKNLRYVLPRVLDFISKKGWKCERM